MNGIGPAAEKRPYKVAVARWILPGIEAQICKELSLLGYKASRFRFDGQVPSDVDVLFFWAPYGRLLKPLSQVSRMPKESRPIVIHWNWESLPNLRIPWSLMSSIGAFRSWVDRLNESDLTAARALVQKGPLSLVNSRMHKFRYLGDCRYAFHQGWLDLLFESSEVHAKLHNDHGLPAAYIPWGTSPDWHSDLNLERDIDVLWFGKWRTRHREKLLKRVFRRLSDHGVSIYVADNVESPFIYDEDRTKFLNRAKITLNLSPTWYDTGFPFRFHLAAANKSLVVSNPVFPHAPAYKAGRHYVAVPEDEVAEAILYYLQHEEKRDQIVKNAHQLVTRDLTLAKSIGTIMDSVRKVYLERR